MKRKLQIALMLLGSMAAGLVIVEIGLRLAGVSYPSFLIADPQRGSALRPGAAGTYTKEGHAFVRINSDGMRDDERSLIKPQGVFRIALLGDSYIEARQVPLEATIGAVMENRLRECAALDGRPVEVLNFGVSGYGTTQELQSLRYHASTYSPDWVVLGFLAGNDLRDNSIELSTNRVAPFYVLHDEKITLDLSFLERDGYLKRRSTLWRFAAVASDHLRLLQLLNEWKNRAAARRTAAQLESSAHQADLGDLGLDGFVFREPQGEAQQRAWIITEAVLRLFQQEMSSRGMRLLVVSLSSGIQLDPDPEVRRLAAEQLGVDDLFYAERRLTDFAARAEIDFLALAPGMQEYAERQQAYLHGFDDSPGRGHWNSSGHRVAGETVAREICQRLEAGAPLHGL